MRGTTVKREKRFRKRIILQLTDELHESIKSWARERGLTVSAAIRLLIAEAVMQDKQGRERGERFGLTASAQKGR